MAVISVALVVTVIVMIVALMRVGLVRVVVRVGMVVRGAVLAVAHRRNVARISRRDLRTTGR